ncbi:alpha-L-fucosidase [Parapedobacter tibetensis]|uniref:alpha-L-fucosidase n=1 Tax=Parapedobacter tibetensis TaxID=2972951 RepID=UPI00214D90F0|nr:alpha-L-fucosidase [Parapedobacter tibetensis]
MKKYSPIIIFVQVCLLLMPVLLKSQPIAPSERPQWFTDARFGMFIHWGVYSAAEGIWKGEPHRHFNNYAEWIMYRNSIPMEEYIQLAQRFDWDEINPEKWVLAAKKAGMKYITITAKHHDGIALWDSKVGGHTLPKLSGTTRDVLAELAKACQKHDIKLGFYYSHWVDWEHPFGWSHNQELAGKVTPEQYNQYWQDKVIPQLRELLSNYGEVAMLWFDMWIPHEQTVVERQQIDQVLALIRELQPNCLINSRLGIPVSNENIDFETLGDNQLGSNYKKHPWQTPGTIAHSWGYNALENQWKSTTQLLHALIGNVSLNGNFMLNVGPRADGSIPYESVSRLEDIGQWLAINGESIYGSGGVDLAPTQHDWGKITYKKQKNGTDNVYLQVYNWPLDKVLRISGVTSQPTGVYLLNDKLKTSLTYTQQGPYLHVQAPRVAPDRFVSVVVLEFETGMQLDKEVVAEASFGGYSLRGNNIIDHLDAPNKVRFDGTRPEHLVITGPTTLRWKIYVDQHMVYNFDMSYSNQGKGEASITLQASDTELTNELPHTGKIVVEPNQDYYTDEFREKPLGKITFTEAGYHEVTLLIAPADGEAILFNRLWMEKAKD